MTPYIFDDRVQYEDVGDAIKYWHDKDENERNRCGDLGTKFINDESTGMTAALMSKQFIKWMDFTFDNWQPKKKYTLESV